MGVVVLLLVVIMAGTAVAAVGGLIDAARRPREVWLAAGFRRSTWLAQVIGVMFPLLAVVYSGTYFLRVRPRLQAATEALGPGPAAGEAYRRTQHGISGAARTAPDSAVAPTAIVKIRGVLALQVLPLLAALAFGVVALAREVATSGLAIFLWGEGAVITVVVFAGASWFGINLSRTEAVVNSFRRRHTPWTRVQSIRQESFRGGRRVVLWADQNERIPLRAPMLGFTSLGRRRFDSDFARIGSWWIEHGGVEAVR
jgi:hypothetical protein